MNPATKELPSDCHAINKTALTITGTNSHFLTEKYEAFNNETWSELDI